MFKDILAFVTILGLGVGLYYQHFIVAAELEWKHQVQIKALEKQLDEANEELAESGIKHREELAAVRAAVSSGEPAVVAVKPSMPVREDQGDVLADEAHRKRVAEEAAAQERKRQEELRKRERATAIAKIDAEIARGKEAERRVRSEIPPFQERGITGGAVRTSDADRQKWLTQHNERLKAIQAKLAELRIQRKAL